MVKSGGGQRESDGVVVPVIGAQRNALLANIYLHAFDRAWIKALSLFLRGWGNYFRTGNASTKFVQMDRYVVWRLKRLLIKKRGRNLRAGQAAKWKPACHDQGLHQLMGTIRYPKAA
jgi:hypothetical protein